MSKSEDLNAPSPGDGLSLVSTTRLRGKSVCSVFSGKQGCLLLSVETPCDFAITCDCGCDAVVHSGDDCGGAVSVPMTRALLQLR